MYSLVVASIVMSIVASYAAFSFAERVAGSRGTRYWSWLISAASAMGLGIWSTNYIGMLSLRLRLEIVYHLPIVGLSFLVAVGASAMALAVVSRKQLTLLYIALGGALMGGAIGGMHYIGMAAILWPVMHSYNPPIVALSLALAVTFSCLALWISFSPRLNPAYREWQRLVGAVLMGTGISAMHYTAMTAVTFFPGKMLYSSVETVKVTILGVLAVVFTTIMVLLGSLMTAIFDQKMYRTLETAHAKLANAQAALLLTDRALRKANLQLKELTIRDSLTGAFNRRHLDASLDTEVKRAARTKLPLSLLMVDIDCFKALNDRYGHPRGDECLRQIARTLSDKLRRPEDVIARYGGEEFAILLPGANSAGAFKVAGIVRDAVEELQFPNEDSPIWPFVTVSIGIHTRIPRIGEPSVNMLVEADAALYLAKANGRNAVQIT
jgi:diguanylate cyclase (GGDEF)-like protein